MGDLSAIIDVTGMHGFFNLPALLMSMSTPSGWFLCISSTILSMSLTLRKSANMYSALTPWLKTKTKLSLDEINALKKKHSSHLLNASHQSFRLLLKSHYCMKSKAKWMMDMQRISVLICLLPSNWNFPFTCIRHEPN